MMPIVDEVPRYVLDASVLLKPLLQEGEEANLVEEIMALKENCQICVFVPEIFRYELFNTLTRKRSGEYARIGLRSMTLKQLCVIPIEDYYWETAQELMGKYPGISFYDASYHALAKTYRCPYITADEKYYDFTKKEGDVALLKKVKVKGDKLVVK